MDFQITNYNLQSIYNGLLSTLRRIFINSWIGEKYCLSSTISPTLLLQTHKAQSKIIMTMLKLGILSQLTQTSNRAVPPFSSNSAWSGTVRSAKKNQKNLYKMKWKVKDLE